MTFMNSDNFPSDGGGVTPSPNLGGDSSDGAGDVLAAGSFDSINLTPERIDSNYSVFTIGSRGAGEEERDDEHNRGGGGLRAMVSLSMSDEEDNANSIPDDNSVRPSTGRQDDYEDDDEDEDMTNRRGVGSFRIPRSAINTAARRIQRVQRDRENSNLPRPLLPIVEAFLPANKSLAQLESDMSKLWIGCTRDATQYVESGGDNERGGRQLKKKSDPEGSSSLGPRKKGMGIAPATAEFMKDAAFMSSELLFETKGRFATASSEAGTSTTSVYGGGGGGVGSVASCGNSTSFEDYGGGTTDFAAAMRSREANKNRGEWDDLWCGVGEAQDVFAPPDVAMKATAPLRVRSDPS